MYNILWSPSRFRVAQECRREYFYNYLARPRIIPVINPEMAVGKLLHARIENFYETKGKNAGKPKKRSAKEFADACVGEWKYKVSTERFGPVRWKDKSEPYSLWAPIIHEVALAIYASYASQSPPLFSEFKLPLTVIDKKKMGGVIDEIRYPLTIRDHKSRKFAVSEMELRYDAQFTLYAAMLSVLCADDAVFASKIGASSDDIAALREDSLHLLGRFCLEHHYLMVGYVPEGTKHSASVIEAPKRTRSNLEEILSSMDFLQEQIAEGDFAPTRGKSCGSCLYRERCDDDSRKEVKTVLPLQLDLFRSPAPQKKKRTNSRKQLKLPF
jgi:hypothetical protein